MSASREQLDATRGHRTFLDVPLPESGLTARVRSLSEREGSQYRLACCDDTGFPERSRIIVARRLMMAMSLVDDAGNRLYTDDEADLLSDLHWRDADAIFDACQGLQVGTSLDDAKKNSGSPPTA